MKQEIEKHAERIIETLRTSSSSLEFVSEKQQRYYNTLLESNIEDVKDELEYELERDNEDMMTIDGMMIEITGKNSDELGLGDLWDIDKAVHYIEDKLSNLKTAFELLKA